ncbi:MAG: hypothetical protein V7K24_23300 [Nostoc sp.]
MLNIFQQYDELAINLSRGDELERSRTNFCIISQRYPRGFGEIGARRTPSPLVIFS